MNLAKLNKKQAVWVSLVLGVVTTLILVVAVRLANPPETTHFHANFGLFINGQRDNFEGPGYYEEVQSCYSDATNEPKHRVHMHDNVNNVVHVHAPAVTWGNFFENLDYGLSDNAVATSDGVFVDGTDGNKLTFILNGQEVDSIANTLIKSEDVLLIDYGKNLDKDKKLAEISKTAHEFNTKPDPASCAGATDTGFAAELRRALKFWE